uniref:Putative ovule protein n=1 Tax=Solanum chacoense TaxID=4108 RepID=A0A0V0GY29_SOLCH
MVKHSFFKLLYILEIILRPSISLNPPMAKEKDRMWLLHKNPSKPYIKLLNLHHHISIYIYNL